MGWWWCVLILIHLQELDAGACGLPEANSTCRSRLEVCRIFACIMPDGELFAYCHLRGGGGVGAVWPLVRTLHLATYGLVRTLHPATTGRLEPTTDSRWRASR